MIHRSTAALVGIVGVVGGVGADPLPASAYEYKRPAESGVLYEIGGGWQRIHPAGITYRAEYLRFAPQVSLGRWLYLGAAFQVSRIYSSTGMARGVYVPPGTGYIDPSGGTIYAPQILLGARERWGPVSAAGEVAPTVRWTSASADSQYLITTTSITTIELHARADVWPTPHFSAGVMVGMDLASIQDFQAGLQVAFHFEPYDAMTR